MPTVWIQRTSSHDFRSKSIKLHTPSGAVEELASFIESHLSELDETYEVVERLQSVVRGLEDNIWSGDNSYLKNILLDINTRLFSAGSFVLLENSLSPNFVDDMI